MTKSSNAPTHAGQIGTRTPPASNALKDYLVLDLTRVRSGPTCVRQLADWGADDGGPGVEPQPFHFVE